MKYCIYNGSIATVNSIDKDNAFITDEFDEQQVATGQILLIPSEYETEIKQIKDEMQQLLFRLNRLDSEYHNKSEALRELYSNARGKEYKVINKLLQEIRERTVVNE